MRTGVVVFVVLLVLAGSAGSASALARPPLVLAGRLPGPTMNITPYAAAFTDSSGGMLPLPVISRKPFGPFLENRPLLMPPGILKVATWLRFTLRNSHPTDTLQLVFYTGLHTSIALHQQATGQPETVVMRGFYQKRGVTFGLPDRNGVPLLLLPGQTVQYWVQVADVFRYAGPTYARLYTPAGYMALVAEKDRQNRPTLLFGVGLLACLLFVALFSVVQYATNRDRAYLLYGAYLFVTAAWILRSLEISVNFSIVSEVAPGLLFKSTMVLSYIMQVFYLLFLSALLTVRQTQPTVWPWLRGLIGVGVGLAVVSAIEAAMDGFWWSSYTYYAILSTLNYGCQFVVLVALLRGLHPLRGYVIAGSLCLLAGGIFSIYLNRTGTDSGYSLLTYPTFYFGIGILAEVLFFSTALGRRSHLVEIEKNRMQEQYTAELQIELARRTDEVRQQSQLLEEQRVQQLQTEFDHKLADTEMTALRAQMNPHFIFNCLNSIKLYTLQNDTDKASDYLSKFARLIRLVLENSRADRVPLQYELDALRLYIELEAMRFKEKVQFAIIVSADIDQAFVAVPPLLIQPYVENAIWHGLMHKPDGGTVTITVSQPDEACLHVEITDNGIGRARAEALKSKSAGRKTSIGMQVTADRIRMINQLYNIQTSARILDLIAPDGEPSGTSVVLEISV